MTQSGESAAAAEAEQADSSQPQTLSAYAAFEKALGAPTVDLLDSLKHAVVADLKKGDRRLLHVQWGALEPVAAHAADVLAVNELYQAMRSGGKLPAMDIGSLRTLQDMEPRGLVTPAVKAALDILALHLQTASALGQAATAETAAAPLLFDKPWAGPFVERTHASVLEDFGPAAHDFFSSLLAPPGPGQDALPEAARHFLDHVQAVYGQDVSKLLDADRASGQASQELRGWISKYLLDQKRLWTLAQSRSRLKSLEGSTSLRQEMKNLQAVAAGLSSPGELAALRRTFESSDPRLKAVFTGPELHVRPSGGAETILAGGKVVVSAAYWVDGLGPKESIPVTEIGFVDPGGAQVAHRSQQTVSRANGGPYTFTAEWPFSFDGPVTYRLIVSAPGAASLDRRARIEPAAAKAVSEDHGLAEAAALTQECRFEEADKALKALSDALSSDGGASRAQELGSALASHRKTLESELALYKELGLAVPSARLYATSEQCQYSADKAERALSILKRLPPGCDRSPLSQDQALSEELRGLAQTAERRRLAQEAFRAGASAARKLEDSCRFDEAARKYASALALLDSDPGARCGEWEQEHSRIRVEDLPRAMKASGLAGAMDGSIESASKMFSSGDYAGTLDAMIPLLAAVSSMPSGSCYSSQKEKAAKLVEAAGVALGPLAPESLQATLIPDPAGREVSEVKSELEALARLRTQHQKAEDIRQAPLAPGQAPAKVGGAQ